MKNMENNTVRKLLLFGSSLLLGLVLCSSCKEDDDNIYFNYTNDHITLSTYSVTLNAAGNPQKVEVSSTVKDAEFEIEKAEHGSDWFEAYMDGNTINIMGYPNLTGTPRKTLLTVRAGDWLTELTVEQEIYGIEKDILVPIKGAKADSEETVEEQRGVDKTFDGDYNSYHNSKFGGPATFPFTYEFELETPNAVDYLIYHPRVNTGTNVWGMWGNFEVKIVTSGSTDPVSLGKFNHNKSFAPTKIVFDEQIENLETVIFIIDDAENSRVSCAEMEFYTYNSDSSEFDWSQLFTDGSCSELKSGTTKSQIDNIPDAFYKNIAQRLYSGTYESDYRIATYRPYQDPSVMKIKNRNSMFYSRKDNPTGIWCEPGEEVIIFMGDPKGQTVAVLIEDMRGDALMTIASSTYYLDEGRNTITPTNGGLMYILNLTDQDVPLKLETTQDKALAESLGVKVHIATGTVQGYWDATRGDTQQDFIRLLDNATYTELDAYGELCHLLWNAASWKKYSTDIVLLMERMDWVVDKEWDFMGLYKYDRTFNNRMHVQCGYGYGAAYATNYRTNYNMGYYENLFTGQVFETRMWVLGHEIGHANQFDGIKWTGIGEVSNNIYCLDLQRDFGYAPENMELVSKGYFTGAKQNIRDAGKPHYMDGADGNVFYWKLVPFWQLELYIADALGYTDFYKDLYEYYRNNDMMTGISGPQQQVNFTKVVCDIAKIDLTEFFVKWGFLIPSDHSSFTVTQAMVDEAKAYIAGKNYPKPTMDVTDIEDGTVTAYRGAVEAGWVKPVYN